MTQWMWSVGAQSLPSISKQHGGEGEGKKKDIQLSTWVPETDPPRAGSANKQAIFHVKCINISPQQNVRLRIATLTNKDLMDKLTGDVEL
jgi:hypothetical protein